MENDLLNEIADEYRAQIDDRLKRPSILQQKPHYTKNPLLIAVLLVALFIGSLVLVGSMFGSEVEQVQTVDQLFTY